MESIWELEGKKLRTQRIEVSTFEIDERRVMVEASFRDRRCQKTYGVTGAPIPIGVVHHMTVRLLVEAASRTIEEVAVKMDAVPFPACRETIDSLAAVKGLTITRGFTSKMKSLVGRGGCTHLVELIQALAPAFILGLHVRGARSPAAMTPDWTKKKISSLVNSCHAWKEDGALVTELKKRVGPQ
jgi:hypothetical protein